MKIISSQELSEVQNPWISPNATYPPGSARLLLQFLVVCASSCIFQELKIMLCCMEAWNCHPWVNILAVVSKFWVRYRKSSTYQLKCLRKVFNWGFSHSWCHPIPPSGYTSVYEIAAVKNICLTTAGKKSSLFIYFLLLRRVLTLVCTVWHVSLLMYILLFDSTSLMVMMSYLGLSFKKISFTCYCMKSNFLSLGPCEHYCLNINIQINNLIIINTIIWVFSLTMTVPDFIVKSTALWKW